MPRAEMAGGREKMPLVVIIGVANSHFLIFSMTNKKASIMFYAGRASGFGVRSLHIG
jgi:hypothetical protein